MYIAEITERLLEVNRLLLKYIKDTVEKTVKLTPKKRRKLTP